MADDQAVNHALNHLEVATVWLNEIVAGLARVQAQISEAGQDLLEATGQLAPPPPAPATPSRPARKSAPRKPARRRAPTGKK